MHPTNIKHEVGYLGPNELIFEVGYQQHMLIKQGSDVPFWMNSQEHIAMQFSQYDDPQLKDKTKDELLVNLESAGVDISVMKGKRVGKLQDI